MRGIDPAVGRYIESDPAGLTASIISNPVWPSRSNPNPELSGKPGAVQLVTAVNALAATCACRGSIETGLNPNYFRDFDPVTGRYVESDRIDFMVGSILAYGAGNPLERIDPLCLISLWWLEGRELTATT